MEYTSCIAKRTRAQEDKYLVELCNDMKKQREEMLKSGGSLMDSSALPTSKRRGRPRKCSKTESGNELKMRQGGGKISKDSGLRKLKDEMEDMGLPCEFMSAKRGTNSPAALYSGFDKHYKSFQNEEIESDANGEKETYNRKKEPESEKGFQEPDEVIDVDEFMSDESEYEPEQGFQESYEVIDEEKIMGDEFENMDKIQSDESGSATKQGSHESHEVIDVEKFMGDEFEDEISGESQSHDAFTRDCSVPDEVFDVDNFSSDEFNLETSSENGNNDINYSSDESLSSSDTSNDDPDDLDYEMGQSDFSTSEDSSSFEEEGDSDESYYSEETEVKKKENDRVNFGKTKLDAKKSKSKFREHVPFVESEEVPSASDDSVCSDSEVEKSNFSVDPKESITSETEDANIDAHHEESQFEKISSHVEVMTGASSSHLKIHVGNEQGDQVESPRIRTGENCMEVDDSVDCYFEVEKSNFSVDAKKSSNFDKEVPGEPYPIENSIPPAPVPSPRVNKTSGSSNNAHHEETKVGKIHRHDNTKVNSPFVEKKIYGSFRHSKPHFSTESVDQETVGIGTVEVDGIHVSNSHRHVNVEDEETGDQTQTARRRRANSDICRILSYSIFGYGNLEDDANCKQETAKSCSVVNTLSYRFRFQDEDPVPEEKSELDIEVEKLFEEMKFALQCEEMGSFEPPTVESEHANLDTPVVEKNQYTHCLEGKHQPFLDEPIGIICRCCSCVLCEIKHVVPELAKATSGVSRKTQCEENGNSIFEGLEFKDSGHVSGNSSNHTEGSVWDIIPGSQESMYPHQQEGFEFLWKNLAGTTNLAKLNNSKSDGVGGCIISHAPGTGKTRLTAVFIESYLKLFPSCRPVIIAPASMLLTWEEEFRKWKIEFPFHNLNNLELSGKENMTALKLLKYKNSTDMKIVRMVKLFSWSKGNSILGVSYSLYEKLAGEKFVKEDGRKKRKRIVLDKVEEELREILLDFPGLVVLDEGHTPRNERSCIWNTLLKLQTEKRVILSGTPFQNNFGELFNTLRLVRPAIADMLSEERAFGGVNNSRRKEYSQRNRKVSDDSIEKLKETIAPFVHVHKGNILLQSLPGLRDSIILLTPPPLQKHLINAIDNSQNTFEVEYKVALTSIHPSLIQQCSLSDKEKSILDTEVLEKIKLEPDKGVKTRFLVELIRLSAAKKEKVLIFSQYIQPLELIKNQLGALFRWGEDKILQMQGKLDQKSRQNLISRFNDLENEAKVLLASTKCCSEGISLVGASRVVLLDVVWNPSVERQAISRAYRLGQKKIVYTYHLMTAGTTEWEKYCRQAEKDRLSELVFSATGKENNKQKNPATAFNDEILGEMVGHGKLKDMFEKIIHQPKEKNLIESFGLGSLSIQNHPRNLGTLHPVITES